TSKDYNVEITLNPLATRKPMRDQKIAHPGRRAVTSVGCSSHSKPQVIPVHAEHCCEGGQHGCVGFRAVDKHVVIVGGGIIGLATAAEFVARGHRVTVLEKENRWAAHQSGHNSNVVHSGLYYKPGSAKARMATAGNAAIVAFAREHGVDVEVSGKLVVATSTAELGGLRFLAARAAANGVPERKSTRLNSSHV